MKFVNGGSITDGAYYVGPYQGTLNSVAVTLYCVDFANAVHAGQTWQANLSTITAGSDLSHTRYGPIFGSGALALYQQAAWLTTKYAGASTQDVIDIQHTIWRLFNPNPVNPGVTPPAASSNYWLEQAKANYNQPGINYSQFALVTNLAPVSGSGQVQEFLIFQRNSTVSNVPEPSSLLLMGMGFLAISYRLRQQNQARKRARSL